MVYGYVPAVPRLASIRRDDFAIGGILQMLGGVAGLAARVLAILAGRLLHREARRASAWLLAASASSTSVLRLRARAQRDRSLAVRIVAALEELNGLVRFAIGVIQRSPVLLVWPHVVGKKTWLARLARGDSSPGNAREPRLPGARSRGVSRCRATCLAAAASSPSSAGHHVQPGLRARGSRARDSVRERRVTAVGGRPPTSCQHGTAREPSNRRVVRAGPSRTLISGLAAVWFWPINRRDP
jgi:hypothetical protein